MDTPMVQDLGNMRHLFSRLCTAQDKIIVLGAVKFAAEAACPIYYLRLYAEKMGNIVIGAQQVRAEIRLEMGLLMRSEERRVGKECRL